MRFLLRWQHLEPGSQLHGVDGTLQIIQQLQGYEISAAAWETAILPRRVARYEPAWLDRLALSGEVVWGRLSPHPAFDRREVEAEVSTRVRPTRAAPITLFLRDDAEWLVAAVAGEAGARLEIPSHLSHGARAVAAELKRRGASFFAELTRGTGRLASEVEDGLWELVAAGLTTADGFENLRALVDPKRRRGEGRARAARPRHATGRWALLAPIGLSGNAEGDSRLQEKSVEPFARQLLRRWGVVFRDLLARESLAPAWRDLLVALRRMEARGEIRGGRFVSGFTGEQFARPEAVELLRAVRRAAAPGREIDISPADPLNLVGILLPGPRTATLSTPRLRLRDGLPVGSAVGVLSV